ncbi:TRANSPOSASE FOR INSERTION SEQUENCE ELEMENT IS1138 (FRAGMENT) (Mycoplasma pulmonis) [Mycoplasmopsis pulmonis]|uniref:TRANSPOSASE FOR INSERTION SEQUENCE ELEMENT IS1138 (Mycoplasma pulmonis) n=1 Tax=Mycoplasmopsis pulmonis (strain UAB CTIP) TaxID=272635 RepID=Q98R59_MYCPU
MFFVFFILLNVKLILDHISKNKFDKEWIIHLDHGSQYSSTQYSEIIKENMELFQWVELKIHLIIEEHNSSFQTSKVSV